MEIISTYQIPIFLYACILGLIIGLYYDIFKILRLAFSFDSKQIFFCDVFFMTSSALATFVFILALNFGLIRMYILFGELIGFSVYKLTLSRLIIFCSNFIISTIKNILNFLNNKIISPSLSFFSNLFKSLSKHLRSFQESKLLPILKSTNNKISKPFNPPPPDKKIKNTKRKFRKPLKP